MKFGTTKMAATTMECCMHVRDIEGPLIQFSHKSWRKFTECLHLWMHLDTVEGKLSRNFCKQHDIQPESIPDTCVFFGYHRQCYMDFTNVRRIKSKQKTHSKTIPEYSDNSEESDNDIETETESVPSKRLLRSCISEWKRIETQASKSSSVLPAVCVICKKEKYVVERHSRKRKKEKLSLCETGHSKLVEAARKWGHEGLLLQIEGKDLVAIELRYHPSCHKKYTKILDKNSKANGLDNREMLYENSFQDFSRKIIEARIIYGNEVLRMNSLKSIFVQTVKRVDDTDVTGYRNHILKQRIKKAYPQIRFIKPSCRNESEIVFCENNEYRHLQNIVPCDSDIDSAEDGSESDFMNENMSNVLDDQENMRYLYHSSQNLKKLISETEMPNVWPLMPNDLNLTTSQQTIPVPLYNFLAWMTGLSAEVTSERLNLNPDHDRKILSIAQDLIFLASHGKKQTPKHWALGMTVRHLTNSSQLIGILNGLGHCVSHSSVLEHDTALATVQLKQNSIIPPGMNKNTFSTLVWDNNDFGEETLSGKGTTHNTNGILIQRATTDNVPDKINLPRSKCRTLSLPPSDLPIYTAKVKKGPSPMEVDLDKEVHIQLLTTPQLINFAFCLSKFPAVSEQSLPGWTGFNTMLASCELPIHSKIGYLPVIDASPTEMRTVQAILLKSLDIADELNLEQIVLVMDQAIYSKAQQIRWQNATFQERLIIRLGDFHATMTVLGAIGKRFQESGLEDILVESGLVASGSLNGVMTGHHYNRSVRTHKIVYEAMQRLRWDSFLETLVEDERVHALNMCSDLNSSFPTTEFDSLVISSELLSLRDKYSDYIKQMSQTYPTFAFWSSYIELIESVLCFIRATREGNWKLHLASIRLILPWLFAYDRVNYARYLSIYWFEMMNLETTSPLIHKHFMDGEFAIQRRNASAFSQTACDQIIEQTCNRDSKTKGGLTGISLNKAAVHRWILSFPARAAIGRNCEEMAGKTEESRSKKELDHSRIQKDEQEVQEVCSTVASMHNPFNADETDDSLFNISSGFVAPKDVSRDIGEANQKGENAFLQFAKERLQTNSIDALKPMKMLKLKTFGHIGKKSTTKVKSEVVTLRGNRNLLMRLLMIAKVREVDVKDVLKYNLCTIPQSLANYDGSMCKTNKAALMHYLETLSQPLTTNTAVTNCTTVIDGMALLQQLKDIPSTFGELGIDILKRVISFGHQDGSNRIDFVTDTYPDISIKGCERKKRSSQSGFQRVKITGPHQKTPKQFKKFLALGKNKESLVNFLFEEWRKGPSTILEGKVVFFAHGSSCHSLSSTGDELSVQQEADLENDHEEADTKLLLHASHASQRCSRIVIRSVDTDVLVLAVGLQQSIDAELYVNPGNRVISVPAISQAIGDAKCKAVIGIHAFTGCDSTSAFRNKGKVRAMKLLSTHIAAFQELGSSLSCDDNLISSLERFVCDLYGQSQCDGVESARYNWFRLGCKSDASLPPNKDSLVLHIKRANYQACIFRRSLCQNMNMPPPTEHGWTEENMELNIMWSTLPPAPENILAYAHCSCKKSACTTDKCSCRRAEVSCTELCVCAECGNSDN